MRYEEASANHYIQALIGGGASAEYARSQVEMFAELARGIIRAEPGTLAAWTERELLPLMTSLRSQSREEPTPVSICQV